MENTLPSPASGSVKALVADLGATVAKDAVLRCNLNIVHYIVTLSQQ